MARATVLTAVRINRRKLTKKLTRAGYDTIVSGNTLRVSRNGDSTAVWMATSVVAELSDIVVESSTELLGFRPRDGLTCSFDGLRGESLEWSIVVDIACAVAADVPLAVLDDHAGTVYLVHPGRGLIGPEEYHKVRSGPSIAELLRGILRDRI